MQGRNIHFGRQANLDPLNKVADLFDIQYDSKKGQSHWEQEVRGVLSQFRTGEEIPASPKIDERSLNDIFYIVVGYDDFLMKKRKLQNLLMKKRNIGEKVNSLDILIGSLAKEIKPNKYVDQFGNVYEKVQEEE